MTKKFNLTKMVIVVVLTVLIWVWADRAKTEEFTITNASVKVDSSVDPGLWISIAGKAATTTLSKIVLEGSTSNINKAQKEIRDQKLTFEFFLNPRQLPELQEVGEHSINLADFFRQSQVIKQLELSVKSCEPAKINVQVQKLIVKELNIDCFDESGTMLKPETIERSKVNVYVPEDWTQNARIELNSSEINQAVKAGITKQPFIRLPDGQIRNSTESVKVKLASGRNLQEHNITRPKIGFVFSQNLQGKYTVNLLNLQNVSLLKIRATPEAKASYEQQTFQILLYIDDTDAKNPGETKQREVYYNFPLKYFANGDIELKDEPAKADFQLVPTTVPPESSGL